MIKWLYLVKKGIKFGLNEIRLEPDVDKARSCHLQLLDDVMTGNWDLGHNLQGDVARCQLDPIGLNVSVQLL